MSGLSLVAFFLSFFVFVFELVTKACAAVWIWNAAWPLRDFPAGSVLGTFYPLGCREISIFQIFGTFQNFVSESNLKVCKPRWIKAMIN